MPLYEEKLINPLAVRFSQDRIWQDFQDGTRIEDSLAQIRTVPLTGAPYDLVLRPPFPPVEIIRLRQERREADGERSRDEKGRRLFGEESWFTFDNRRLYCLQRSALHLWPMVVAVVVKVLYDFPEVRCARHKFRTTSDGCTVKISLPDGQTGSLWNWQEAARGMPNTKGAADSILDATKRDAVKSRKEMLVDPPPVALLSPGTREATVAERFNLGASRGTDKIEGKVAGQQLLSLLQGGGTVSNGDGPGGPAVGFAALFAPPPQAEPGPGHDGSQCDGSGKSRSKGRGAKGLPRGGAGARDGACAGGAGAGAGAGTSANGGAAGTGGGWAGGAKGRRRPKGRGGKGDAWA